MLLLFFKSSGDHGDLPSFPTRRSSDLRRQGWSRGTITLARQPASREEAILWAQWLRDQGVTVSIGLRSEEHTSELQSRVDLVCRLLLEKKKSSQPATDLRQPTINIEGC